MANTENILAQLELVEAAIHQEQRRNQELVEESQAATERQRVRRKLDNAKARLGDLQCASQNLIDFRDAIDADVDGPHLLSPTTVPFRSASTVPRQVYNEDSASCRDSIYEGEFIWTVEGMSWLDIALSQQEDTKIMSKTFCVHGFGFYFAYRPDRGEILVAGTGDGGTQTTSASLAVICEEDFLPFRYSIFIRRNDGTFIQWGEQQEVLEECSAFGPDVKHGSEAGIPSGIFGLSHSELLQSEWLSNDTLTAKLQIQVRAPKSLSPVEDGERRLSDFPHPVSSKVLVPQGTICANLLSLFEEGKYTDVTFLVKKDAIHAHSLVLAARSEVFEGLLYGGLRETTSREVAIDDCEATVFRAFLQHLYTDEFSHIDEMLKTMASSESSGSQENKSECFALLQALLSVAHKYQVARLRCWCEQQLCEHLSVSEVCSVLCQAHLCEAQQLEQACLKLVKENMETVAATEEFAHLTSRWPEVSLKLILFGSGVSPKSTASAISTQQRLLRKRKHE
eukprot:TRINITY_DN78130_c0_g1_i1.p1 TRINITY_DN78130_c0_g1~~TRINITY_DN78130_c0_g1_i1.p1  ORF type:complete len:510 (+),score=71.42 TRINITY_DN78130_c0_g1_i1:157-1686(+)